MMNSKSIATLRILLYNLKKSTRRKKLILYPKAHFNNVKEISIKFLKKNNIKALILDVDNTLIDYDRNMPDGTVEWVEQLKHNGIKFYIVSNTNKKDKVEQVSQKLKIKYNLGEHIFSYLFFHFFYQKRVRQLIFNKYFFLILGLLIFIIIL